MAIKRKYIYSGRVNVKVDGKVKVFKWYFSRIAKTKEYKMAVTALTTSDKGDQVESKQSLFNGIYVKLLGFQAREFGKNLIMLNHKNIPPVTPKKPTVKKAEATKPAAKKPTAKSGGK